MEVMPYITAFVCLGISVAITIGLLIAIKVWILDPYIRKQAREEIKDYKAAEELCRRGQ